MLAGLKLKTDIVYQTHISPICINYESNSYNESTVEVLKRLRLKVTRYYTCRTWFLEAWTRITVWGPKDHNEGEAAFKIADMEILDLKTCIVADGKICTLSGNVRQVCDLLSEICKLFYQSLFIIFYLQWDKGGGLAEAVKEDGIV